MPNPNGTVENLQHYQPKWKSGKTQTIRVPIALADEIMEYARKLDRDDSNSLVTSDISQIDLSNNSTGYNVDEIISHDTSDIVTILEQALKLKSNAGGAIKERIREALRLLKPETSVRT